MRYACGGLVGLCDPPALHTPSTSQSSCVPKPLPHTHTIPGTIVRASQVFSKLAAGGRASLRRRQLARRIPPPISEGGGRRAGLTAGCAQIC